MAKMHARLTAMMMRWRFDGCCRRMRFIDTSNGVHPFSYVNQHIDEAKNLILAANQPAADKQLRTQTETQFHGWNGSRGIFFSELEALRWLAGWLLIIDVGFEDLG